MIKPTIIKIQYNRMGNSNTAAAVQAAVTVC